ncbi:MAG: amino acid ABC transporter permease [Thermomicrobiales bacterium]
MDLSAPSSVPNAPNTPNALSAEELAQILRKPPFWRRPEILRSTLVATVSTVVVVLVRRWLLMRSAGWASVQAAFFSAEDFKAAWPKVWDGFKLNVRIFMIAEPIVLLFGLLLAIARGTKNPALFPIRALAIGFIDLFRGAPALLVILALGFGMPGLRISALPSSPVFWGTVAVIITSSAYTAETFRAGIESIHPSQRAAARSLGLTGFQTFTTVVLPQGVRRVIPPLISGFVGLQKETSLVAVIGPLDATRQAQIYASLHFNYTSFLAAALLFILVTIPLARLTDYLMDRTSRDRQVGGLV